MSNELQLSAEESFAEEIVELISNDSSPKPFGWKMSPRSVLTYICGGKAGNKVITPKYIGHKRLVEICISTLITDRALLLTGEPGTAKSWLSEHLAAAISGDSKKIIQGSAGTTEEQIRYSWNYAMLLTSGPSQDALVKSPVFRAMEEGSLVRFEEVTRCLPEIQDALISILSEKRLTVPELGIEKSAIKGFSLIATANTRDRGVNDMSAALKRRFNLVTLPPPKDLETEMAIVEQRVKQLSAKLDTNSKIPGEQIVKKVVTIFRELRSGMTLDSRNKIKSPSGILSTAEAISLLTNSMALAGSFGSGQVEDEDLAAGLQGAIIKNDEKDSLVWQEYLNNVMKRKGGDWQKLYSSCCELS
ncbi:MAG: AAA family ATPase [Lentisphaeraceae bacterium]|nr:AAA family ATPase [Lentisphaeraceae bacterium]